MLHGIVCGSLSPGCEEPVHGPRLGKRTTPQLQRRSGAPRIPAISASFLTREVILASLKHYQRLWAALVAVAPLVLATCAESPQDVTVPEAVSPDAVSSVTEAAFTAEIIGPSQYPGETWCTWTAEASGGVPPYEYEWIGVGDIVDADPGDARTSDPNQHILTGDGTIGYIELWLKVWDSPGNSAQASRAYPGGEITYSSSATC